MQVGWWTISYSVYTTRCSLCLKEGSKPLCFLDHLFQPARLPFRIGIHFQWLSDRLSSSLVVGRLFQVSVKSRFGFLYCGVYSVSVGLEEVALEFAR